MNVDRVVLSPNHSEGWLYRRDGTYQGDLPEHLRELPNKLFIHSTRSGRSESTWTHENELAATISWFLSTASSASSHLVISPTETVRMVPDNKPSWHAREHSWQSYAIEVTQPIALTPYEHGHYERLAEAVVHYMGLGVQLVHLQSLAWGERKSGIIGHEDSDQGVRDGKSDPGRIFDWQRLLEYVQDLLGEEGPMKLKVIQGDGSAAQWILGADGRKYPISNQPHKKALIDVGVVDDTDMYPQATVDAIPRGDN